LAVECLLGLPFTTIEGIVNPFTDLQSQNVPRLRCQLWTW